MLSGKKLYMNVTQKVRFVVKVLLKETYVVFYGINSHQIGAYCTKIWFYNTYNVVIINKTLNWSLPLHMKIVNVII